MTQAIVIYEHKHGVDYWLTNSKAEAERSIIDIIFGWLEEGVDSAEDRRAIIDLIIEGEYSGAIHLYCDTVGDEIFHVKLLEDPVPDVSSAKALRQRAQEFLDRMEEEED